MMWYPKKKQILYAPMLSSFGGGSSRGFNPGGGGGDGMAVLGAAGTGGSTFTNSGYTFYKADNSTGSQGSYTIPVTTAGYIFVAGIGASGGGGYQSFTISSNGQSAGGIGVGKVLIPDGTTTLYIQAGQGGRNDGQNTSGVSGGSLFGGRTGYQISGGFSQYSQTNGSGGGLTGVFTTDVSNSGISIGTRHSSSLAVLGAGGGNGSAGSDDSTGLGHGGGFNQSGLDYKPGSGYAGRGASTSAGGAAASNYQYITENEFTGNPPINGSQLTGGGASGSDYDLGGGGGAGYYGGGGAADGGGYNGHGGGGGSGYLDLTGGTAEVYHASTSYLNTMSTLSTAINNQFSTSLSLTGDYGSSLGTTFGANVNGYAGYILVWT